MIDINNMGFQLNNKKNTMVNLFLRILLFVHCTFIYYINIIFMNNIIT